MPKTAISFLFAGSLLLSLSVISCQEPNLSPTGASPLPPSAVGGAAGARVATGNDAGLHAGSLAGRVTHALDGHPVAGVTVEIAGAGAATTASDGGFSINAESSTRVPLQLSAEGFHPRQTHASVVSVRAVEIDLLPRGDGFDLDFFDHVFRNLGADGTERWTSEPRFVIWTKACECRPGELGECSDLFVTEQNAPGQFLKTAQDVILADATKYTGGFVRGTQVTTETPPSGSVVTWERYLVPGQITVIFVSRMDRFHSFARVWPRRSGAMYAAAILMHRQHKQIPFVYSHELAHTMGFSHPVDYAEIPLPSTMRDFQDGPTRPDMLHGRVLYRRPPGSRTPDIDPETYSVNLRASDESAPDPMRIRLIRN